MTRRITLLAGLYALLGGIVSLAGWALNVQRLTDWQNNGISIQPNATLCVIFSGLALLLLAAKRCRIAATCGAAVLSIGGLTLLQWISGFSFGIDALLMFEREWGRVGVLFPGRMGPPGSFSWTLLGMAFVLSAGPPRLRRWAPALALTTAAISSLSLIGYLYQVDKLYALPHLTVIALQTSSFIMALSLGIITSHPEREPMHMLLDPGGAGVLARRVLPLLLLVPIVVGYVRVLGQDAELYDTGLGSALVSVITVAFLAGLMWWVLNAVRVREQALRESEAREHERATLLQIVLDTSPSPIWVALDRRCERIMGNPAADNLLGVPGGSDTSKKAAQDELNPVRWLRDGIDVPAEMLPTQRRAAREGVAVSPEEYEIVRGDGTGIWLLMHASPLIQGGQVGGAIAIAVDITRRKIAEDALRETDRRKDEFLATLAHELRNPLAPVRNAVQLLHMKGPDVPELQWARDVIDRQMQQMTRLIDDLMDVSRISRGKIELKRERVALATVVHGAVETSRPLIEQCGHELTVNLPPHNIYLDADLTRLAQVFANLLNNSAKYTERGGQIWLNVERQGSDVVVSVKDSGIGIPREKLPCVFDLFSQVQGALERSQGGLGIGLSLVKRLVEMHDGTIDARSEGPGTGSEFVVRMPILVEQPCAVVLRASNEHDVPTSSLCILIVDDNRDAADSLGMILRMMGNEIHMAYDGEDAVRAAGKYRPQVALLDIGLPKLNGYEACRRIRQEPWGKYMVLIAVTGWGQEEDKRRAEDAGFDRHLVKPVDPRSLIKLLGSVSSGQASEASAVRPVRQGAGGTSN